MYVCACVFACVDVCVRNARDRVCRGAYFDARVCSSLDSCPYLTSRRDCNREDRCLSRVPLHSFPFFDYIHRSSGRRSPIKSSCDLVQNRRRFFRAPWQGSHRNKDLCEKEDGGGRCLAFAPIHRRFLAIGDKYRGEGRDARTTTASIIGHGDFPGPGGRLVHALQWHRHLDAKRWVLRNLA